MRGKYAGRQASRFFHQTLHDYLDEHLTDILSHADCGLAHLDDLQRKLF